MNHREQIRDFLTTRRAKLTPAQVGLPTAGTSRRVAGLRREEAAMLAGVSVDYYTRLERGNLAGASDGVLDALARGLRLDDAEREHLFNLARTANAAPAARRRTASPRWLRPAVQQILDSMIGTPARVHNARLDVLAANPLGRALYAPLMATTVRPANNARFTFLDPCARDFYRDWTRVADDIVAILRAEAGRHPYDKDLTGLIGELSTRSLEFRTRWAAHDVRSHHNGIKRLRHPLAGDIDLTFEAMALATDQGLTLVAYVAEPGSASAAALRLLALTETTAAVEAR
ncbi:helix-turn-helix transcriptional regulator [Actinoplanes couchii]|uniref:Transcriptional regulator n=1 Tax=Actinoplanes couchii TaxID=403638 RepID=A0ABQ3XM27_9ACTN|nr:helix-turn-helix transcriptional regulator [Actinoplanes couchii]MDR6319248.1 transcriptional regulator with XRE-family HTH domain [Actinoplanes couchii]GID59543.1 transcriptional regulator [Actinoplanes couchii]